MVEEQIKEPHVENEKTNEEIAKEQIEKLLRAMAGSNRRDRRRLARRYKIPKEVVPKFTYEENERMDGREPNGKEDDQTHAKQSK